MNSQFRAVQHVIRSRRTEKVFAPPDHPIRVSDEQWRRHESILSEALADCGMAPFHFDRKLDGLAEPWRIYWLDWLSCRRLGENLDALIPDLKPGNKLAGMLAGCTSLVLFTWLPEKRTGNAPPGGDKLEEVDREHLAATAAAVQNFLLLGTAAGYKTYWGSGQLIEEHLFAPLGVGKAGRTERLLGAVFVHDPAGNAANAHPLEIVTGKLRERRSTDAGWLHRLEYRA